MSDQAGCRVLTLFQLALQARDKPCAKILLEFGLIISRAQRGNMTQRSKCSLPSGEQTTVK